MISEITSKFIPDLYLDTFFDYVKFIENPIGKIPKEKLGTKVAIVGAGAAGLMAARLLLQVGLEPVIYEASDRVGGRLYSKHFTNGGQPVEAFAELGAMRIPLSANVFFKLANEFKMDTDIEFPDPGLVDTLLNYRNKKYFWKAKTEVPEAFAVVKKNWEMLVAPLIEKVITPWQDGDLKRAQEVWQNYIDHYKGTSFYDAIRSGSPVWAADELNRFGTLGIGTGGFGPVYNIGFIEILRIILHRWENNQMLIKDGVETFATHLLNQPIFGPGGNEAIGPDRVRLNHRIQDIELNEQDLPRLTINHKGKVFQEDYQAVIVATTTRAMQFMGLTLNGQRKKHLLSQDVQTSLRKIHMINSSKLFIRTEDKFWQRFKGTMPQTVLSDDLFSGTYMLDYPQTKNGVICVSYTWGDESSKISGLDPEERFRLYKESIRNVVPDIAEHLIPVNNEILHIDWQAEKNYHGAFKLNLPGQEDDSAELYFQFQSVKDPEQNTGIYLAGDSVSWAGGWVEGALQTAVNAACSALVQCGGEVFRNSPLDLNPNRYNYK